MTPGGRVGTFRGIRQGKSDYGALAFGSKGIVYGHGYGGYEPLLVEICRFFRTGRPPVEAKETLEIFAFMEAADESKRQGVTKICSILPEARGASYGAIVIPSWRISLELSPQSRRVPSQ